MNIIICQYFILIIISLFFWLLSKNKYINSNILIAGYIIIISYIVANRNMNYRDTIAYIEFYEKLGSNVHDNLNINYFEPGFVLLSSLIKQLFQGNYKFYFYIITSINLSIINVSINNLLKSEKKIKKINNIIFLILYMLTCGFMYNFVTLRVGLAFSFVLLAISYIEINKIVLIILLFIACSFHTIGVIVIILLPFVFCVTKVKKHNIYLWFIVLLLFLYIGYKNYSVDVFFYMTKKVPFLSYRFYYYLNENNIVNQKALFIRFFVFYFTAFLLCLNYGRNYKYNFIFCIYLSGLTIFALFFNILLILRIIDVLIYTFVILLIYAGYIKKDIKYYFANLFILFYFIISNYRFILAM